MKTLVVECPDQIHADLTEMVKQGWVSDPGQAVVEALRRFLESHRPELISEQVRRDVDWGLHGDD
ncbi:MAG: CopG family transcriptional regulator [Verrucomicrobiae bacterium]|nr:CopG family transcriptional regulator [Verrucomicrobiae bacterium]